VPLRVDAYFPEHRPVVEYMGEQHSEQNPLMDRRPARRTQRAKYQERRLQVLTKKDYRFVRVWHHEPRTKETVRAKLKAAGIRPVS
jgi:very-short-patch-repair endonuclease